MNSENKNGPQRKRYFSSNHHNKKGPRANPGKTNHRPQRDLSTGKGIHKRYLELLEQHLQNRKKYFERFNRGDIREQKKLEKEFFASAERLNSFEHKLTKDQKMLFHYYKKENKLDLAYSENHNLLMNETAHEGEVTKNEHYPDPHLAATQKLRESYAHDTEESTGTPEDYLKLKGKL